MGQQDVFYAVFGGGHGKLGGIVIGQMARAAENAFFEVVWIGSAAQGFHIMIGFQNQCGNAAEHIGGTGGYIAGIRQNPHGAVGAVEPIADAVAGIVGCGKGGDTECAHTEAVAGGERAQQRRNTGKAVAQVEGRAVAGIDGRSIMFEKRG